MTIYKINALRTVVERLGRDRTLKRTITIGDRKAEIIVSPDAQLKYIKPGSGSFDQDLLDIAATCLEPSDRVWDIGANVGVFTLASAICAQCVVAFEADVWLASLIRRTASLPENSSLNISVVSVAVSDRNGIAEFQIAARGRASNALTIAGGRSQMGGVRERVLVPTLCLDTLLNDFNPPDFIKIDVEGAELMVVSGGAAFFERHSPLVYVEVGQEFRKPMITLFEAAGYSVYNQSGAPFDINISSGFNLFFARDKHLERLKRLRQLKVDKQK